MPDAKPQKFKDLEQLKDALVEFCRNNAPGNTTIKDEIDKATADISKAMTGDRYWGIYIVAAANVLLEHIQSPPVKAPFTKPPYPKE